MKNVLVTASGSPGFLTVRKAIRACTQLAGNITIHGCDSNPSSLGLKMVDFSFVAPQGSATNYVSTIYDYCKKNSIDLIIPCADEEMIPLSRSVKKFEDVGCMILSPPCNVLETCLNKKKLFDFFSLGDLSKYIVENYVCNDVRGLCDSYDKLVRNGYSVCVKPVKAHGSRGFRVIEETPSRDDFFDKKPVGTSVTIETLCQILGDGPFDDLLVMEYLPGVEYSVDSFKRGHDFLCIPRTRRVVKEGICVAGQTCNNKELINIAERVYNELGLRYNANIQFRYDREGRPKLLEINPRFSGTMEHCRASGVNFVEVALHEAFDIRQIDYEIKWGVKMQRVWSEVFEYESQLYTLDEGNISNDR